MLRPGADVLVLVAPLIPGDVGHVRQVGSLPVLGLRRARRLHEEGGETLRGVGVLAVVDLVGAQRGADRLDVGHRGLDARFVGSADEAGHHDRGQDADDDDDEQELDQGEALRAGTAANLHDALLYLTMLDMVKTGSNMAMTMNPTTVAMTSRSAGSNSELNTRTARSTWRS